MFRSIRWRIAIPFVLLVLVGMLGMGIYLNNFVRETYMSDLEAKLATEARLIGIQMRGELDAASPKNLDGQVRELASLVQARVTLIGPDGTVLGDSQEDPRAMDNHSNRPEVQQALAVGQGVSVRYSSTAGYDMMYVAVPAQLKAGAPGVVRVALPLQEIQDSLRHIQSTMLWATLLATALAVLLSAWIAGRTTRPLRQLTEAAAFISGSGLKGEQPADASLLDERLASRILPPTNDEVGQLTQAFNTMSVQLRNQFRNLEMERHKLATVLDEMTDGVLMVGSDGTVELMNPAAGEMFAITHGRSAGRSLAEALRQHQVVDLWRKCQADKQIQSIAIDIPTRGLFLHAVAIPLGEALPGSTLLLFQNLTRLRQLETVRRDFISNISHELRTPLASLKALAETLQSGALEDPPAAHRFIDQIETEVDSLSLMVTELLELARIESGRVPLQLKTVDPCDIVAAAADRLRLQAERAGLTLHVNCDAPMAAVLADAPRLEQALVNLLHNAIKFTPFGGAVVIGAGSGTDPQLTGLAHAPAAYSRGKPVTEPAVLFYIRDTGEGIPSGEVSRVFERFYKADRSRSKGGTGLGLAIASHLVEAHHGEIGVSSRPGQGSFFYFLIPQA